MKLHLIRHGKAVKYNGKDDHSRTLSKKGVGQIERLTEYLGDTLNNVEAWSSSSARTIGTLEILSNEIDFADEKIIDAFYLCSKEDYLDKIWKNSNELDIVIIGHNFGISDLVNYLSDELTLMSTGEYICLDFNSLSLKESSKGTGIIVDRF